MCVFIILEITGCEAPREGYHTVPQNTTDFYTFDDTYTYACLDGYESDQPLTVTCLTDGTWSSHPPECTGKNLWYSYAKDT